MTIHLIGVEKEADLASLFECLLPFLPKTLLCIHMIGLGISETLPQDKRAILLASKSNDSSLFISINHGQYSPAHNDASAFKLPPDFPKELSDTQNFGQEQPDFVIALNANLIGHQVYQH